jgi:hypothetical protein
MKKRLSRAVCGTILLLGIGLSAFPQSTGVRVIRAEDMKFPLRFLGAPEFRGRSTPSVEQDIAGAYIALMARQIGLRPLLPDGYKQKMPVDVITVLERGSSLRLMNAEGERTFGFPDAFGISGRQLGGGEFAGGVVFMGYGLEAPQWNWDDYAGVDLKGKVAVFLDVALPNNHVLKPEVNRRALASRSQAALARGASAVVTIIPEERDAAMAGEKRPFEIPRSVRFLDVENDMWYTAGSQAPAPPLFVQVEVRRDAGAAILGIDRAELDRISGEIRDGKRPAAREIPGASLNVRIALATVHETIANVVGWIEGRDPALKNEYVLIGSHYDHAVPRNGKIFPGADDDASGVVGMFEIAEAMTVERPKRSVIFVWHTAEESGLLGASYFAQHCPVPVESISAVLNLDMISRNAADHLYIIGAKTLSTELDASLRAANARGIGLRLDAKYDDPADPERFFFRSDHFPYIRFGIPGVWIFCGTTPDYHQEGDVEEKADYVKMEKISRLTYLAAMDIGDRPGLLKLDVRPEVTARGKQNRKIDWTSERVR